MPRYDYRCKACRHVSEEVQGYEVRFVPCPSCGGNAERVPIYREQYIAGETVARSGFTRSMYKEMSAELDYEHKKAENEVGHELPSPNYYKHQLARAEGIDPNARASAANRVLKKRSLRRERAEAARAEGSTLHG